MISTLTPFACLQRGGVPSKTAQIDAQQSVTITIEPTDHIFKIRVVFRRAEIGDGHDFMVLDGKDIEKDIDTSARSLSQDTHTHTHQHGLMRSANLT